MYLYINILILLLGLTSLYLAASFLEREMTNKGFFKWSVVLLSIGNALCCIGYSIMSISENLQVSYIFRVIGLIGINVYLLAEIILVTSILNFTKKAEHLIIFVVIIAIIADVVIWGHPDSNIYIRYSTFTTYITNDPYRRLYHNIHLGALSAFMFFLAILWGVHVKYKRDKHLVFLAYISNIILLSTAFADIFRFKTLVNCPHFYYCLGMTIAFSVFYRGASKYTTFHITVTSISKDIFSTINTGLLVLDTEGKLALANNYARKLLGLDSNPESDRLYKIFDVDKKTAFDMRQNATLDKSIDYRLTSSITKKVVLVNLSCKYDKNNDPICYLLVATDLTEENRLIEEAQSANIAKSSFISNISHEIRTPINVVLGMDELILRECSDENILRYAENIDVASRTLLSLINDVLDFSKIESGKLDVLNNEYKLGTMLYDSYNLSLNLAKTKHQQFDLDVDPSLPSELAGDDVRIRQVISNILSNAVKYTPEHGEIIITVRQEALDEQNIILIISVTDNGIGIKPEDQPHVFENFQRLELEKNRSIQGTGLGLAITKNLVTLMHGTISLESEYGKGSTFTVRIPQTIVDSSPIGEFNEHYSEGSAHKHTTSFIAPDAHILSVDDVQMNLDVFTGLLKQTKVKIDTALSGTEALKLISKNHYDIIFLDHMMPEMDGIEVHNRMQKMENNPNANTPVIMLTANATMGADKKYLNSGFTDYLSKPIKPSELEKVVYKHLPIELIQKYEAPAQTPTTEAPQPNKFTDKLSFLDVDAALEFAAGDEDFLKQIITTYINEDKRPQLDDFFAKEDWPNYQIVAHSLKGTSRTIGANELSEAAKSLEFGVKENHIEYIKENHAKVMAQYGQMLDKLKAALT